MKLPNLRLIEAFLAIYNERNITIAAQSLNLSKATLTKRLNLLEEEQGQLLFRRNTRRLSPTPEGELFYRNAVDLFEAVKNFEGRLHGNESMKGTIRLTASSCAMQKFLSQLLIQFQENNPEVDFDVIITDSTLDMIEHNLDISVRVGVPTSTSLYGQRIADNETILCATPDYIQKYGSPSKIEDLKNHKIATIPFHQNSRFSKSKTLIKAFYHQQDIRSNDAHLITDIALRHRAILVHSKWFVLDYLKNGQLIPLLIDDPLEANGGIWLLSSAGPMKHKRVEALYKYLYSEIKNLFTVKDN